MQSCLFRHSVRDTELTTEDELKAWRNSQENRSSDDGALAKDVLVKVLGMAVPKLESRLKAKVDFSRDGCPCPRNTINVQRYVEDLWMKGALKSTEVQDAIYDEVKRGITLRAISVEATQGSAAVQ